VTRYPVQFKLVRVNRLGEATLYFNASDMSLLGEVVKQIKNDSFTISLYSQSDEGSKEIIPY
jgi:NADPH-dependent 7-cyano-7-deazaguanine reductase QueF-like protein